MNLLQPLMLAGLAAALIPIFVHLYNRKRAMKRPFPAISFLIRSNQKVARRLKVRQWLLLLLRIGVFVLLPLALAKPFLPDDTGQAADSRLPAAIVYILDDSFSMTALDATGQRTHFEAARTKLLEHLDGVASHDRVALVLASDPDKLLFTDLLDVKAPLVAAVEDAVQSDHRGDMRRALEVARDLLIPAEQPVRKVILLTDMTRSAWPDTLGGDLMAGIARVEIIDVGEGRPLPNAAITDAGAQPDPSGQAGSYELWAEISTFATDQPMTATVTFALDGALCTTSPTQIPAGAQARLTCTHTLKPGSAGHVTISLDAPQDTVLADNTRYLRLNSRRDIRALLVNGDPRPVPLQDELFFTERALKPNAESVSNILPRIITPDALGPGALAEADVVLLANVASLSQAQALDLTQFVERGGGLLISTGDKLDREAYNRLLPKLLPRPLHDTKLLALPDDPDAPLKVTRLSSADYSHPILRPFGLPGGEGLQKAMVYRYTLVRPDARSRAKILLRFADDSPALLESTHGQGRILLLTTTLDRDWNELPLNKSFLPLARRSIEYLAFQQDAQTANSATVGKPSALPLPPETERLELVGPTGERIAFGPQELKTFDQRPPVVVSHPGFHATTTTDLNQPPRLRPDLTLTANLDPRGSDTTKLSEQDLSALWSAPPDPSQAEGLDTYQGSGRRVELWPILLLVALVFLYLESLLGLRRSFWQRKPAS